MNTKWHCERHEGGWLIVADWDGKKFAQHLKADQMKTAHEPGFVFWSAVGSISRAISAYRALHENQRKLFGLRKHLDKLLSTGWRVSCRDPLCIACGGRSATVVEGMLIEQQIQGLRRVGDMYERVGVSHG